MNKSGSASGVTAGTTNGTRASAPDAQVRLVTAEWDARAEWERACRGAGVSLVELAENYLGVPRAKLYEAFAKGPRHPRLAWVDLLPIEAQVAWLRRKAEKLGFELRSTSTSHATLGDVARDAGRVLAALAVSEADGHLSPAESASDIEALDALAETISQARAKRLVAISQRGLSLAKGAA